MKFRNLDPVTLDWTFGKGRQNYVSGSQANGLDATTAVRMFQGESFFDLELGLPWFQILGLGSSPSAYLLIKSYVEGRDGVIKVNSIDLKVSEDRLFKLDLNLTTIFDSQFQTTVVL